MEPKNCPCCNSIALCIEHPKMDRWAYVHCVVCGIQTKFYKTKEEAIAVWDRRDGVNNE